VAAGHSGLLAEDAPRDGRFINIDHGNSLDTRPPDQRYWSMAPIWMLGRSRDLSVGYAAWGYHRQI